MTADTAPDAGLGERVAAVLAEHERATLQKAVVAWARAEPGAAALYAYPAVESAVEAILATRLAAVETARTDAEVRAAADEGLARALLTLAEVETAVRAIERYLETNGKHLPIDAKVPMRAQTEVMRNALNKWRADSAITATLDPEAVQS